MASRDAKPSSSLLRASLVLPRELSELASVANGGGSDLDEHFMTNIPSDVHIVTF